MKITFHGAAQVVTGSKHLLQLENGKRVLLDCGMFQGMGSDTNAMNRHFGFDPATIDYVILSHAHIDHSGLLPRLVDEGYKGRIYCTPATYDLCKIMLADSAHIQEADVRFVNKRKRNQGKEELAPLYTMKEVEECLTHFEPVECGEEIKIDDFIHLLFTNNGHILGSAAVNLRITEGSYRRNICFTGDIGRYNAPLLKDPLSFPQADVIICESTYGDRLHDDIDNAAQQILNAVIETCSVKKGRLIIPAFSLGRTQEVVYALNKLDVHGLLPDVKFYVDSPLACSATEITRTYLNELNERVQDFRDNRPDPFGFDDLTYITDKRDSMELNTLNEPCVIISASGMAEAGRSKHHVNHALSNPANTILLVGYAEPLSLAGKLMRGDKQVTIFGEPCEVKAEIIVINSFSAHGDYNEMLRFLSCQDATQVEKVFLVHGDPEVQEHFKGLLGDAGFPSIYIPAMHSSYFC